MANSGIPFETDIGALGGVGIEANTEKMVIEDGEVNMKVVADRSQAEDEELDRIGPNQRGVDWVDVAEQEVGDEEKNIGVDEAVQKMLEEFEAGTTAGATVLSDITYMRANVTSHEDGEVEEDIEPDAASVRTD